MIVRFSLLAFRSSLLASRFLSALALSISALNPQEKSDWIDRGEHGTKKNMESSRREFNDWLL